MTPPSIPPGSTIGILGGGQLGRMTALAAGALGYRVVILCPEPGGPASQVTDTAITADYTDRAALDRLAGLADVVTVEFENIPAEALDALAGRVPVRPNAEALRLAQDRLLEKRFAAETGARTAPFRAIDSAADLPGALEAVGAPAILKTRRLGYDGKGQAQVADAAEAEAAFARLGGAPAILEARIDFERELSVIVARAPDGSMAAYDPVENRHENHILRETIAPAPVAPAIAAEARALAETVARRLGIEGLLAVELFQTPDGALLVNELAPRPHNSGHWTLDACATSQFEQLVRAICGLPLGSPERHADARMVNLLGDEADDWAALLADPAARVHLYGKAEARPGRKMGHVTWLAPRSG